MMVLRETVGADKQDEVLVPSGKGKARLADGHEVELDMASWEFIGDMHVRFAFDEPDFMVDASPQDLARLNIANVDEALALALANLKRVYGEPTASSLTAGVMQVHGKSPDLDSSYFLDRKFWRGLLKGNPGGLVVAAPNRGALLYASAGDRAAVEALKNGVGPLYARSGRQQVSSALYLYKDDKWSVFQPAVKH